MAERPVADIAAALVRAHRAQMPQPEELIGNSPDARRAAQAERLRPGFVDTVWFRMDIGRPQTAYPRWLIALPCRSGQITKNEGRQTRIGPNEKNGRAAGNESGGVTV